MPSEYRLILKHADEPGYTPDIECYLRHDGYDALKKALALQTKDLPDGKKLSGPEQIRREVMTSGLRGRGGAGFSSGLKWSFVDRKSGKPIYLICNADESEPGTFKDRQIIYKDPHQLIEGMVISCFANDVHLAYIYIRGEMLDGAKLLNKCLQEARAKNFLGKNILGSGYDLEIYVHRGAGAYICGEETGLIESLEGKRPYPRIKPPYFPAVFGLWMCPTIVNNVETLCNVKHIVAMGGAEFAKLGTPNNTGTRIVSLSGHVKRPGYYEIETGKVTILRYTAVQDAGRAIHPSYVEGQMQGGVAQGIGWALNEEYIYDSKGHMENPGFLDYRIPVASDLPMIEPVMVEVPNPNHPYGAKGAAEVNICPPLAAIANAIQRATGRRLTELPMSPPKVLAAIDSRKP